jgi:Ca-activated chloride channel homolog
MNMLQLKSRLLVLTLSVAGISGTGFAFQDVADARFADMASSQPDQPQPAVIRVQSSLVTVPVSVTDASGNAVLNLGLDDFRIEEDGRKEELVNIAEAGAAPLELALLVDISGSVQTRFDFEKEAAGRFLRRIMKPGDRITMFSIGSLPEVIQARTADLEEALGSLNRIAPTRKTTAFYDAVVMAAHLLSSMGTQGSRRALIVLSDGEDNNSVSYELPGMMQEVQRADCIYYSINPAGPSIWLNKISTDGQSAMQALAAQTGGAAFLPDRVEDLPEIFDRIAQELHAQYLLEYYSREHGDGSFHKIVVRVPTRSGLRIRARLGYYSLRG